MSFDPAAVWNQTPPHSSSSGASVSSTAPEVHVSWEHIATWAQRYDHWLRTTALPLWWSLGADHQGGGFHELLNLDGTAKSSTRRARVQTRQSYVFAKAGEMA